MATTKKEIFQVRQDVASVQELAREVNIVLARLSITLNALVIPQSTISTASDLLLSRPTQNAPWDAQGRSITNGADATHEKDLVTLSQAKRLGATSGTQYVDLTTNQTVAGEKTFADPAEFSDALAHTGTTLGFFGQTPAVQPAAYTPTNVTPDRSFDANTVLIAELADVVGTLIADLQTLGLLP